MYFLKQKTGGASQIWTLESADKQLQGVTVDSSSAKTTYYRYETLDTANLSLKATYTDGTSKTLTSGFTTKYDFSKAGTAAVTVSYTDDGVTKSASYNVTVKNPFSNGSGTESDPYLIENRDDLFRLEKLVNGSEYTTYNTLYYKQTADIDLEGEKWIPIGSFYENDTSRTQDGKKVFDGHYDGDYHSVTNLNVDYDRTWSGLFAEPTARLSLKI